MINAYVHGNLADLQKWLADKWPCVGDDCDKPYSIPPQIAWKGPYLHTFKAAGTKTDDEGNTYPVFARYATRKDVLCLIQDKTGRYDYDPETDTTTLNAPLLAGIPGTVYTDKSREEIAELLPEFARVGAIPFVS